MNSLVYKCIFIISCIFCVLECEANDILGCGGFVKSHTTLDFSKIVIGLYTKSGSLKEKTECAPTNGYYFLPLYEKGDYVLKIHPPAGWSFQPQHVDVSVDGVTDSCSTGEDMNFMFNGFGITGTVLTEGQTEGPSGVKVTLSSPSSTTRSTETSRGGHFHFTPVNPEVYTLTASHPRWKLNPSTARVSVREGNTELESGALKVAGYDVSGTVVFRGTEHPVTGVHVLLYSKEENPKYRVEGCQTALLQGVPDAPICHVSTSHNGVFTFGVVPAGEYKLLALRKSPQATVHTYNFEPDYISVNVKHDSLFIEKAFEVLGLTVTGVVLTHTSGTGVGGARVSVSGTPVSVSDKSGHYTLPALLPGTHVVSFQHDECEIEDIAVVISSGGLVSAPPARVSRWRVCGFVRGPAARVLVQGERVDCDKQGNWCTLLPSGVYTASVVVTEEEKRQGLQYYPVSQQISVGHGPVRAAEFSQLRAEVRGHMSCSPCPQSVSLSLGSGNTKTATVNKDGDYSFKDIVAGSVELSVDGGLCWEQASIVVPITAAITSAPTFRQTGHAVLLHTTHETQMDYKSETEKGTWSLVAGRNSVCVKSQGNYLLTPRGCHKFSPEQHTVRTGTGQPQEVFFKAISHATVISVRTPGPVSDLIVSVTRTGGRAEVTPPLKGRPHPEGGYLYEHTVYLKEGEKCEVTAKSRSLLVSSGVSTGQAACSSLQLQGRPAIVLAGRLQPPAPGAILTLRGENGEEESQVSGDDGSYSFGPLDAGSRYSVSASRDSYVFSEPDADGNIHSHKLAEIAVVVKDADTQTLLQGALVSVSGGSYRRNVATDVRGAVTFPGLSPADYFLKPHLKEYSFRPAHHIVTLLDGERRDLVLQGVRVSWSAFGAVISVGGAGLRGATVLALSDTPGCFTEEAVTEDEGTFRIRGLIPNCEYTLTLKPTEEWPGLKIFHKNPIVLKPKGGSDLRGLTLVVSMPEWQTEGAVLVWARTEHYKTLRVKLYLEDSTSLILNTALDFPGFDEDNNPGYPLVLPRLPVDNNTYVVRLESTLSKYTHSYEYQMRYIVSDGQFKDIYLDFKPQVRSSDQELGQTSLLVVPVLVLAVLLYRDRVRLLDRAVQLYASARLPIKVQPSAKPEVLDKASIDQIVNSVNAVGKREKKRK